MDSTPLKNRPAYQVIAGRIARFFGIHFFDLYYGEKLLTSPIDPVVPSLPTRVRLATAEDLNRIICRIGGEIQREFDHNSAISSTCYVALHEDTVSGYIWVNRQLIDLVGMYVAKLPARHSFSHNAFIFPEYRCKKIYQYLRHAVCSEMYKSGCLSIACLVDKANTRSIEVLKNEGIEFHNAAVLKLPGIKPVHFCRALASTIDEKKEKSDARKSRYRLSDIPHLIRSPLGRIQFVHGIYYRLWPLFSALASGYRTKMISNTRIVSVVGSYGKTTTTRAVTTALQRQTHRKLYLNCWSSVSAAIFRIRPRDRHAVIEVGISDTGQMDQYAGMIRPDIAVVTSIGSEHNRSLGSLEVTRAEKAKMVKVLPKSGLAVLNGDDPNVRWMAKLTKARVITYGFDESNDVRASKLRLNWPEGLQFRLHMEGATRTVSSKLIGRHMVYPILAAITVAVAEGFPLGETLSSLRSMPPAPGRLEPVRLPDGVMLLRDDCKSSLETVHVALDVFSGIHAGRRGVVMGEVSEPPGSQGPIYKELGRRIAAVADYAVFVGRNRQFQRYVAKKSDLPISALFNTGASVLKAAEYLRKELKPGDTVLIKGRGTQRLERIALVLQGRKVRCDIAFCDTRVVTCEQCPMLERGWEGLRVVI